MSEQKIEPAFPGIIGPEREFASGMTLRDYFAAKALQGLLACPEGVSSYEMCAETAYSYADAMLKARGEVQ